MIESKKNNNKILEKLFLIGFRLDPKSSYPDFYAIFSEGENLWPLNIEKQIILFQNKKDSQTALDTFIQHEGLDAAKCPENEALVIDLAQTFFLITKGSEDSSAFILNAINILTDMLALTESNFLQYFKNDLDLLANHLTFHKSFGELFERGDLVRNEVLEALQWLLGVVISKSMFVPKYP